MGEELYTYLSLFFCLFNDFHEPRNLSGYRFSYAIFLGDQNII